ncbi:hypothetical protein KDL44_04440 [bacterium]|nr:hypothetical protein [bacterium]
MGSNGKLYVVGMLLSLLAVQGCGSGPAGKTAEAGSAQIVPGEQYTELQAALLTELERRGIDPQRSGSAAPDSADNAVLDLRVVPDDPDGPGGNPPAGVQLSWTHRLVGDYDQNGVVGISDVTPLGQFFGQAVAYEDVATGGGLIRLPQSGDVANARRAQVDGDGNGLLSLADLTAIAAHWEQRLDGYRVYRRGPRDSGYQLLPHPSVPALKLSRTLEEGSAAGGSPLRFEFNDTPPAPGWYDYIVRAYDGESGQTGPQDRGFSLPELPPSAEADHMVYFGEQYPDVVPPVFGGGMILLIRDDNGIYSSGYDALRADLQWIQADFDETGFHNGVGLEVATGGYESAIWYRGGFGGPFPQPLESAWSAAELEELHTVLDSGRNLLLLSQNHADRGLFIGSEPNGWQALGYSVLATTVDPAERFFTHMEGLPTERGLGPGGGQGLLPVGCCSLLGGFETDPLADDGMGRDDGERYAGSGGRLPHAIRLPEGAQFSCRAWSPQVFFVDGQNGMGAAEGFQPGLFLSPYTGGNAHVKGYVSWGCTRAPYGPLGLFPEYTVSTEGTARYWVIGYSWAEVQVLQDPESTGEATLRCDMLCNVLEWLRAE